LSSILLYFAIISNYKPVIVSVAYPLPLFPSAISLLFLKLREESCLSPTRHINTLKHCQSMPISYCEMILKHTMTMVLNKLNVKKFTEKIATCFEFNLVMMVQKLLKKSQIHDQ